MNGNLFIRILLALVFVLAVFAILGPLSRLLGFPMSSDVTAIVRVCVAAIAVFYIVTGSPR